MRDIRGRYLNAKPLTETVPAWAQGCDKCECGIAFAPDLTGAAPLYMERIIQHLDGSIAYCDCRAGKAYRASLGNRYRKLIEEARKDRRMTDYALRTSHPDIEAARRAIHAVYEAAPPPTIHAHDVTNPEPVTP
jgi:hypothetical protein